MSPIQISAPVRACRMWSIPSRRGGARARPSRAPGRAGAPAGSRAQRLPRRQWAASGHCKPKKAYLLAFFGSRTPISGTAAGGPSGARAAAARPSPPSASRRAARSWRGPPRAPARARDRTSQPRRCGGRVRDMAQLAGEADLAEGRQRALAAGERFAAWRPTPAPVRSRGRRRARPRARRRPPRRRVARSQAEAGVAGEHGQHQREPVAVHAVGHPARRHELGGRHQRLHLHQQRARALHGA